MRFRRTGLWYGADNPRAGMTLQDVADFVRYANEFEVPLDTPIAAQVTVRGRLKALHEVLPRAPRGKQK